jgi:hypothetical protein
VAEPSLGTSLLDLSSEEWMIGDTANPRPILLVGPDLLEERFEQGVLGRCPTPEEIDDLISAGSALLRGALAAERKVCPFPCQRQGRGCAGRCSRDAGHGRPHTCDGCEDESEIRDGWLHGGGPGDGVRHRLTRKSAVVSAAPSCRLPGSPPSRTSSAPAVQHQRQSRRRAAGMFLSCRRT